MFVDVERHGELTRGQTIADHLGRTAALLALGALCLRFHELFNVGIGQFIGSQLEPRWLKNTLLFGIPVLIVGAQIAAEWAAERKRRQSQALAIKIEAVPKGYFRIGPYLDTAEDRAKFDRADRIHEKVLPYRERSAPSAAARSVPIGFSHFQPIARRSQACSWEN
jgi:hypothetical protein